MRPFVQTCSRLGRRSASCSGTVSSRHVCWPSLRLLLVTLILFAGCSTKNDQQAAPQFDESEVTSETQSAGEPQPTEQVEEQPDAEPVPPTAAEIARARIEELGGGIDSSGYEGWVNLGAWHGDEEDLPLLLDLPTVSKLTLAGPTIQNGAMRVVAGIPDLSSLWLRETAITDAGLAELDGHPTLEELSITSTPITDNGLAHIATLTNLKVLWLTDAEVGGAGFAELRKLSHLEGLLLLNMRLVEEELAQIEPLLGISSLRLSGTGHNDGVVAQMIRLSPGLQGLSICPRPAQPGGLTDMALAGIRKVHDLQRLSLIGGWVDDETMTHLSGARRLKTLNLIDSSLTDNGLAPLARFVDLEYLSLKRWGEQRNHVLTDGCVDHLRGMNRLKRLVVSGNLGISRQALYSLQENVPDLSIADPQGAESPGRGQVFRLDGM